MEDQFLRRKTRHAIAGHNQLPSSHEESIHTGKNYTVIMYHHSSWMVIIFFEFNNTTKTANKSPCSQPAHSFCPLLLSINFVFDIIKNILQDLEQLSAELRADVVYSVSKTGGHLSSSLGVVELSVALHHVFNTPEDKIIWDVGHQVSNFISLTKLIFFF